MPPWFDYLDLLGDEGKDLRNAHYVCPDNLNSAHDFIWKGNRRKEERNVVSVISETNGGTEKIREGV